MQMGGRMIDGWLIVEPAALRTESELAAWVERSVSFVNSLPAK
jgi:mannitol-1-phosphate/altronate dehydrogenase